MILALAGNPNCGKTTLFNALTGANARTGNFPGVTVTRSEGVCRARPEITLVDLPGVYALRPYSDEERVTRSYLLGGTADAVISIADATCPARSLYLTLQLLELGVPVVLALNVMDALRAGGGSVDTAGLARALGIPVVPVSAALGEGLDALLDAAAQAAHGPPPDPWRALAPGPVQTCVRTLARLLAPAARTAGLPSVFAATQWLDDGGTRPPPKRRRRAWCARAAFPATRRCPRRALRRWTGWRGFSSCRRRCRAAAAARASTACSRGGTRPTPRWRGCSAVCFT